MNIQVSQEIKETMNRYRLPEYSEITNVGLYLNQVAKYINEYMEPFCEMNITESMISNYVKKHLLSSPVKKQYDREQIATLLFIAFVKSVLSMDNIQMLLKLQKEICDSQTAYDHFVREFEHSLKYVFGTAEESGKLEGEENEAKNLCHDVILTVVRKLHLDHCLRAISLGEGN